MFSPEVRVHGKIMRKRIVFAVVGAVIFALALISVPVSAAGTFTAILTKSGDGVAKARASAGANCQINAAVAQSWFKTYQDGTRTRWEQNIDFSSYSHIKATLFTDLEAPGWSDVAYRGVNVYKDSTLMQSWVSSTGENNWEFTQETSVWSIGTSGTWKFIVDVAGTDWGSPTCYKIAEFWVY